jgi:hypothetical protein
MTGRVPEDEGDVQNCAGLREELTMFRDKATLLRRRNRAVTLIEAVLYISIALALIVGGWCSSSRPARRPGPVQRSASCPPLLPKAGF